MKIHAFGDCDEVHGEQYALSLYTLAESVQAKDILEIGAGWGWSARAFALSLENRTGSRLVSVDRKPQRLHRKNRKAIISTGINWSIIEGNSADVEIDGEFDLIYIDGAPHMVHADFLRFYPKLRAGGLMVVDGYGWQFGPTDAVDSLSSSYQFASLPYKDHSCHAVHRKPREQSKKDGFLVICQQCGTKVACQNWRHVDQTAYSHALQLNHRVQVRVEPRGLSYMVMPKGDM